MRPRRNWAFIDKCYIAKFYDRDGCISLASLFSATQQDIHNVHNRMRNTNKLEKYKLYWDLINGWKSNQRK